MLASAELRSGGDVGVVGALAITSEFCFASFCVFVSHVRSVDRGGRSCPLRFDPTVLLSRAVSQHIDALFEQDCIFGSRLHDQCSDIYHVAAGAWVWMGVDGVHEECGWVRMGVRE